MKTISLGLASLAGMALLNGQTTNPFPQPIAPSAFVQEVRDFATIPRSGNNQPARVNQLLSSPDGRIFTIDQRGAIYTISADGAVVTPWLNLATTAGVDLLSSSEQGFQSMAFHPEFATVGAAGYGKFYTAHSTSNRTPTPDFTPGGGNNSHDEVVLEWTAAAPTAATFTPANAAQPFRSLIRMEHPYANHNTGLVAFNPNARPGDADYGKLYIGTGDGGSGGDPLNLAQNPNSAFGKILRIDPLGTNSANGQYGVPGDNPFVGQSGRLGEVWASGLRNPQRFSWDVGPDRGGTGRMFIGDIGQNVVEEINLGMAGANYGWKQREGSFVYLNGQVGANSRGDGATTGFTYPVAEYDHSEGAAITAGFVHRGGSLPGLDGRFLFGDLQRGRVFFFDADLLPDGGPGGITELRLSLDGVEMSFLDMIRTLAPGANRADLRFGQDAAGNLYLLNKQDGIIRTFVAVPEPATVALLAMAIAAGALHRRRRRAWRPDPAHPSRDRPFPLIRVAQRRTDESSL